MSKPIFKIARSNLAPAVCLWFKISDFLRLWFLIRYLNLPFDWILRDYQFKSNLLVSVKLLGGQVNVKSFNVQETSMKCKII